MTRLLISTALVGLSFSLAHADTPHNWLPASGDDGQVIYFDSDSIRADSLTTEVWVAWIYKPPGAAQSGMTVSYMLEKMDIECQQQQFWLSYGAFYDDKGSILKSFTNTSATPISPNSVAERLHDEICTKRDPIEDANNGIGDLNGLIVAAKQYLLERPAHAPASTTDKPVAKPPEKAI